MTLTQVPEYPSVTYRLSTTNGYGAPAVDLAVQSPDHVGLWLLPVGYEGYSYPHSSASYAQVEISDLVDFLVQQRIVVRA